MPHNDENIKTMRRQQEDTAAEVLLYNIAAEKIFLPLKKIKPLFSSGSPFVRVAFLECLSRYAPEEQIKYLFAALKDKEEIVRLTASEELYDCVLSREQTKELLLEYNKSRNSIVRRNLAIAIAQNNYSEYIPIFKSKLQTTKNEQTKAGIYIALILLGERGFLTLLSAMLNSADYRVVCFIANSIGNILPITQTEASFVKTAFKGGLKKIKSHAARLDLKDALKRLQNSDSTE